ncbi:DNA-binding transcriptional regulator, GntR family [Streptomyces sp. di188]|nr:DNA-binding transcriptional regulator, GntR family [Streptomyces sp. di50b]SCE50560.1 DNA-binding transcriptional regulator, GntR family [Streptomyces sp. di188]
MSESLTCDVVVVGAGMTGAACALYAARAGLDVTVVGRGPVAGGTTGAGEGNLLVSDKAPGPELDLALLSLRLWAELAALHGPDVEYDAKGGLAVAETPEAYDGLRAFAGAQRAAGVTAEPVPADRLHDVEPRLAPGAALIAGELGPARCTRLRGSRHASASPPRPVREALLDLAEEGLVDAVPGKGYRVTAVSERQLDECTRVRALIEIPTTAALAATADPAALAALRPVAEEIVAAAAAGDLHAYVDADRRFPLTLLELAGNAHLVEVVRDLRRRSRLYGLTAPAEHGELRAPAEEHLELLGALLARDSDAVREVMTRHLGHVRDLWAAP